LYLPVEKELMKLKFFEVLKAQKYKKRSNYFVGIHNSVLRKTYGKNYKRGVLA
jgi:hypothetical protein